MGAIHTDYNTESVVHLHRDEQGTLIATVKGKDCTTKSAMSIAARVRPMVALLRMVAEADVKIEARTAAGPGNIFVITDKI